MKVGVERTFWLVRQLLRRPALVVSIDVRIDLCDLDGRMSEQGLHGTQLGAALDQIGGISMAQLMRRQAAHGQIFEEIIVLPAERAGCHITAALCRHDIDTRFRCVRQHSGKLFAVGDDAHPLVLGHIHGRELAFGNAGNNAPDSDRAVLTVDIAPAQSHDLLAAQTGVQQNSDCHAERSVKMREQAGDFVRLVDRDVLEGRVRLHLDTLTRVAAAQTVRHGAFHDLVDGDEDMMAGAAAEVRGTAQQPFNVGGPDFIERRFAEHGQDIAVEVQLVIGVGAVPD